ncbi:hypothetical protein BCV70DRAFT_162733 [Testicularia cyperi]|uniref:Haem-binding uptake Tiki superfamily ChaN domain-containing protein n=1 Tax=Testicularia cyperi TaxID=1882483 RepID=A0A317XM07_9BASI|nr:hypothetical protein BCV70DRAFT_162733 [Testicularia cyperi]
MSIAKLVSRFTKPRLLASGIPTYRHSFSLPIDETSTSANVGFDKATVANNHASAPHDAKSDLRPNAQTERAAKTGTSKNRAQHPAYVEWSQILPMPSTLLSSFGELFQRHQSHCGLVSDGPSSLSPPPRLTFFGEQHHQPHVMRAQLQVLHDLHAQCLLASDEPDARVERSNARPRYRLHLILEQFSVLDQGMLSAFSQGRFSPQQLADAYVSESEEGFHIGHYMPLLMLARELDVPIWGGFPPRSWARSVFRDGVDSIMASEKARAAHQPSSVPVRAGSGRKDEPKTVRGTSGSPLFTAWSSVSKISAAHRSYLSSLMRPDMPPRFPAVPGLPMSALPNLSATPSSVQPSSASSALYPTWLLNPFLFESKGFAPAQALKDTYLAHVTAWILRGAGQQNTFAIDGDAQTNHGPSQDRPVVNVALVVCGLGHCEYGFGAPERVLDILQQSSDGEATTLADSTEEERILPYIIASKPLDSGIWLGYEHALEQEKIEETCNSKKMDKPTAPVISSVDSAQNVDKWRNDPWSRKMADAVVLYDWIDEEPEEEPSQQAAETTPTPNTPAS